MAAAATSSNDECNTLMVVYNGVSAPIHTLSLDDAPACFCDRIKGLAKVEDGAPMATFGPFDRADKSVSGLVDTAADPDGAHHAAIWKFFDGAKSMDFAAKGDWLAGISIEAGSAPDTVWPRPSVTLKAPPIPQWAIGLTDVVRCIERGDVEALETALRKVDADLLNRVGDKSAAFFGARGDEDKGNYPTSLVACLVYVLVRTMDIHMEMRDAGDDPLLTHLTRPRRLEMLQALLKHRKTQANVASIDDCMTPIDYAIDAANHLNGEGNASADCFRCKVAAMLVNSGKVDHTRPLHLWVDDKLATNYTLPEMAWALKDWYLMESVLGARLSTEALAAFHKFVDEVVAKSGKAGKDVSHFTKKCQRLAQVRVFKQQA
tara:strand:- start:685 stop:1812 length:1128 start_codon:yes stop_codon:yes gene_type:complete